MGIDTFESQLRLEKHKRQIVESSESSLRDILTLVERNMSRIVAAWGGGEEMWSSLWYSGERVDHSLVALPDMSVVWGMQ